MKILAAFLGLLLCIPAGADQTQSNFKYGERTGNSIFDPKGVLTPQEKDDISAPLREILKNEGIDILVVILPEIGDAPPMHVAREFAEKWATTTVNSVVLHVPGKQGSPWIFPGEVMAAALKPESVKHMIAAAEKRAAAEPTDFGKVRAASVEAADAIRYWLGGALLHTEERINKRLELQLERDRRERLLKLSAALGAAALIPLAFAAVFLTLRMRGREGLRFPQLRKSARLGAPYSGGGSNCSRPVF
ncbi:TPM domain-containing protein [Akkermansiaceae bacterium]|nr:TPM domain-containing protein [Akkermansiaceae bacterium]